MRANFILSSSLLAMAVSGVPIDLPKPPAGLPSLPLPALPLPAAPPLALPGPISTVLPVRRAGTPALNSVLKDAKLPALSALPTGVPKLPTKRADVPIVGGLSKEAKLPSLSSPPALPKLPVDSAKLPVKRTFFPFPGSVRKNKTATYGSYPKPHLPPKIPFPYPHFAGHAKGAGDYGVEGPSSVPVDHEFKADYPKVPTFGKHGAAYPAAGNYRRTFYKPNVPHADVEVHHPGFYVPGPPHPDVDVHPPKFHVPKPQFPDVDVHHPGFYVPTPSYPDVDVHHPEVGEPSATYPDADVHHPAGYPRSAGATAATDAPHAKAPIHHR